MKQKMKTLNNTIYIYDKEYEKIILIWMEHKMT